MQPLLTQRQASEMLALSERWPEVRALWSEFVDLSSKQILVEVNPRRHSADGIGG